MARPASNDDHKRKKTEANNDQLICRRFGLAPLFAEDKWLAIVVLAGDDLLSGGPKSKRMPSRRRLFAMLIKRVQSQCPHTLCHYLQTLCFNSLSLSHRHNPESSRTPIYHVTLSCKKKTRQNLQPDWPNTRCLRFRKSILEFCIEPVSSAPAFCPTRQPKLSVNQCFAGSHVPL